MNANVKKDSPHTAAGSDSKCPLCGSGMTTFGYSHSDGDWTQQGPMAQQCLSRSCGLPVKLWQQVAQLRHPAGAGEERAERRWALLQLERDDAVRLAKEATQRAERAVAERDAALRRVAEKAERIGVLEGTLTGIKFQCSNELRKKIDALAKELEAKAKSLHPGKGESNA